VVGRIGSSVGQVCDLVCVVCRLVCVVRADFSVGCVLRCFRGAVIVS
jgi:hypothetical protein